ncbi:MAG: type II toxin-antitoxin system RelE/ParE family toxin [Marvinbryantia sp.]|uniref:type II toxin-antitoxin system RelE/ParE family toxin n=1 Tax=Marvinbryantia sp. TaxID=2496532 RepID=UPI00399A968B
MESKWDYQLTRKADADLDEIVGYIAVELANPKAASDFVDKLQATIEEARSFPESGSPVVNEYLPETEVRKKVVGNYIMYYLPDSTERMIFVLRIVYGRRNMDEILRQINK